ncbi:3'-5' exonuclease family protein [Paraburkholderia bannensis]|uniref:3'-5' exoribonuclease n=1 Tax=Paraburkholderia bannensis TaxID=765414 RepID=UPI002AB28A1C|nr:3'-5' exoribonuclease [Paraburkholderia bannensis]
MTYTNFHGARCWPLPDERQDAGWNNRYFIDTEFTDFSRCQLISLAIVGENGSEFYGERTDFDPSLCSDFVRAIVLPQLGRFDGRAMPFVQLREELRAWFNNIPGKSGPVLCYDYETDLNLCRFLLGGPLPHGWRAENIAARRKPGRRTTYYARHGGEHHALHDARANAYACVG